MKTTKYALAALALIALVAPTAVRADIVQVTLSNLTFTGNNVCGPSGTGTGTSPCMETFNGSFLWDNTTQALVPNSAQLTQAGPLNGALPLFDSGIVPVSATSTFVLITDWVQGTCCVSDTISVHIGISTQTLGIGTYSIETPIPAASNDDVDPGNWGSFWNTTNQAFVPPGGGIGGAMSVFATAGSVTVSPVPEPSTLFLFGTGLLGLVGAIRRKWLT